MDDILQTTFSIAFFCIQMVEFWFKFEYSLFLVDIALPDNQYDNDLLRTVDFLENLNNPHKKLTMLFNANTRIWLSFENNSARKGLKYERNI